MQRQEGLCVFKASEWYRAGYSMRGGTINYNKRTSPFQAKTAQVITNMI